MEPENAGSATVDVWVAPLDVPAPLRGRLLASLSPAERRRADSFRDPEDGRRFFVAHGWLRHVLAAALGTPAGDVPLTEDPRKPRLAATGGPCFNLSHAGELALVAVSDREVGVDVERLDRGVAPEAVRLACTQSEAAALDRLPDHARAEAFLRLWTAKEAYLKGRGLGLTVSPDWVEVGMPDEAMAPVRMLGEVGAAPWWVRELRPAPGYVGAVAAEGTDWRLALRTTAELGLDETTRG